MAKNKYVKVQLEVNLDENDFDTFKKEATSLGVTPIDFIKESAEFFLVAQSHGGLMLAHDDIKRVEKNAGIKVSKPSDIVSALENSKGKPGGQYSFRVEIDPALATNIEEFAKYQGLTVDQVVMNWWSFILANGWLSEINPDGMWVPFNGKQLEVLKSVLGSDSVTSVNILNRLTEADK